jgi:hypothetical protein
MTKESWSTREGKAHDATGERDKAPMMADEDDAADMDTLHADVASYGNDIFFAAASAKHNWEEIEEGSAQFADAPSDVDEFSQDTEMSKGAAGPAWTPWGEITTTTAVGPDVERKLKRKDLDSWSFDSELSPLGTRKLQKKSQMHKGDFASGSRADDGDVVHETGDEGQEMSTEGSCDQKEDRDDEGTNDGEQAEHEGGWMPTNGKSFWEQQAQCSLREVTELSKLPQ